MTAIDIILIAFTAICAVAIGVIAVAIIYVAHILRNEKEYMERHLKEVERYDTSYKYRP